MNTLARMLTAYSALIRLRLTKIKVLSPLLSGKEMVYLVAHLPDE